MTLSYSAFGLQLRSEFPLAGMTERNHRHGGSPLALELITRAALMERWSGDERTARWRGQRGDGSELSLARGPDADLLFVHADRACFHLDRAASRLRRAPQKHDGAWQRTLLGRGLRSGGGAPGASSRTFAAHTATGRCTRAPSPPRRASSRSPAGPAATRRRWRGSW